MKLSKKLVFLVAGAVAALAAGSLAFAAIPDGNGLIHGCYEKGSGHLRVADPATNLPKDCTSKEVALDWNQQGPKGDRGPSDAYSAEVGYKQITTTQGFGTVVASRSLPPGKYVLSAKLTVSASGLNVPPSIVHCELTSEGGNGGTGDFADATVSSNASGDVLVSTLALENNNTGWSLANGGAVKVRCDSAEPAEASFTQITAIQVGSLN